MKVPSLPSAQQDTFGAESIETHWTQTGPGSSPEGSPVRQGRGGRNLAPPPGDLKLCAPDKRNRLKQLRLFCYTALTLSITKAAERASVTQPSASQQVRALEQELRIKLFERRGPHLALTAAGRHLYEISMPLVENIDNLYATFHERFNSSITGEVRISAEPGAAGFLLPRYLKQLHEQHPHVRIIVKNAFRHEALKLLREHAVDFAVASFETVPDDFRLRLMKTSEIMLAALEAHPLARLESVSVKEIEKYPLILPPVGSHTRHLWDLYAVRHHVKSKALIEVGGWWIIRRYIQSGLGISVLPKLCDQEGGRISLIPFVEPFPELPYGVLTHRDMPLAPAARLLIQMMVPVGPAAA